MGERDSFGWLDLLYEGGLLVLGIAFWTVVAFTGVHWLL